jgi:flagellar motor switch protein FliM
MSDEVLSQAEVESLLNAMEIKGPTRQSRVPHCRVVQLGPVRRSHRMTSSVQNASAKNRCGPSSRYTRGSDAIFGAALSGLLRSIVEVKLNKRRSIDLQ